MLVNQQFEDYILHHTSPEDPVLSELSRETHLKVINPRMLSGHPQGKILEFISKMVSPRKILEIGTYTGYSAICLAKGLKPGGELHTIEKNDELLTLQTKYFIKSGFDQQITQHVGDAIKIIPTLNHFWDLVFIDADKKKYTEFLGLILPNLNKEGIIVTDNVLWDGKVIDKASKEDPETIAIKQFNKTVVEHPELETIILPVRDGISIVRKQ